MRRVEKKKTGRTVTGTHRVKIGLATQKKNITFMDLSLKKGKACKIDLSTRNI